MKQNFCFNFNVCFQCRNEGALCVHEMFLDHNGHKLTHISVLQTIIHYLKHIWAYYNQVTHALYQCCESRSGIRCFFDPGIRVGKKSISGIRDKNPRSFFFELIISFWVKYTSILWCGSRSGVWGLVNCRSGIRVGKNRIWDKHPWSATLSFMHALVNVHWRIVGNFSSMSHNSRNLLFLLSWCWCFTPWRALWRRTFLFFEEALEEHANCRTCMRYS
jgi:hypothetical protein